MECNEESRSLHRQAFQQPEYILGNTQDEDEFISPDLEITYTEGNSVFIKGEPNNAENDCCPTYDDEEIKEEPCSPENTVCDLNTETVGPPEVLQYTCSVDSINTDNNGPYIVGSVYPNDIAKIHGFNTSSSAEISGKVTEDLDPNNSLHQVAIGSAGVSSETMFLSGVQEPLSRISQISSNFNPMNQDVHILALIPGPSSVVEEQDPEEEVQVQVSNKWIESRGDTYVNLSILSGFPNPQVTKSISLTREGIQIFVHRLPLKNTHSIWNILGSNTAIEKGQSLSTIANLVEKMNICTGCWDQKCRDIWEEGVFGELGFVEFGFSPSPVYRTFSCHLLIDSESRGACTECRAQWTNMVKIVNKKRKKAIEPRDLDKINYKFLTKNDMETALREAKKETSQCRKQIAMLHKEIDELLGRDDRYFRHAVCVINDKVT